MALTLTRTQVACFWLAVILILAAIDVYATYLPGDDSFSATVRAWTVKYPWIRVLYPGLVILLSWHLWGS